MPMIDKPSLQALIVAALERDLDVAQRAAQTAYEAATHEENVAENKYDTLGLEASYLATGQVRRMAEITQALTRLRAWAVAAHAPERGIQVGDCVALEDAQGGIRLLLLAPDAAGLVVQAGGETITLITPRAPLGQALMGKHEGDDISMAVGKHLSDYQVLKVY